MVANLVYHLKIQPSEAWGMTPTEYWELHNLSKDESERMGYVAKTGSAPPSKRDVASMLAKLESAKAGPTDGADGRGTANTDPG